MKIIKITDSINYENNIPLFIFQKKNIITIGSLHVLFLKFFKLLILKKYKFVEVYSATDFIAENTNEFIKDVTLAFNMYIHEKLENDRQELINNFLQIGLNI